MSRLRTFARNVSWLEAFGLGLASLIFLGWGVAAAADGRWSAPVVWSPVMFFLARPLSLLWARGWRVALSSANFAVQVPMSAAIIAGIVRSDEWLFMLGLGCAVWFGIGEWFWRVSDARWSASVDATAKASA